MFKGIVSGRIKYDPEFKMIKGDLCCNFTLETFEFSNEDKKSFVRCSCFNEEAIKMKKIAKGTVIFAVGNASNIQYDQDKYVYNLKVDCIEIIDMNMVKAQERKDKLNYVVE